MFHTDSFWGVPLSIYCFTKLIRRPMLISVQQEPAHDNVVQLYLRALCSRTRPTLQYSFTMLYSCTLAILLLMVLKQHRSRCLAVTLYTAGCCESLNKIVSRGATQLWVLGSSDGHVRQGCFVAASEVHSVILVTAHQLGRRAAAHSLACAMYIYKVKTLN